MRFPFYGDKTMLYKNRNLFTLAAPGKTKMTLLMKESFLFFRFYLRKMF